jgi:hypothetical protein
MAETRRMILNRVALGLLVDVADRHADRSEAVTGVVIVVRAY